MPILGFKKIRTSDGDLMHVQDQIEQILNPIVEMPIMDGHILSGISLNHTKTNSIAHGLGRKLEGYIIIKRSANATVWDSQSVMQDRFLDLHCSADVIVSIYVF